VTPPTRPRWPDAVPSHARGAGADRPAGGATPGRSPPAGRLWETDPDLWWRDVEVNLRGPALALHAVLPSMLQRGSGRVVVLGSGMGAVPTAGASAYSTSKAAVLRLVDTVAAELAGTGVVVIAVSPGMVPTDMTRAFPEGFLQLRPSCATRAPTRGGRPGPSPPCCSASPLVSSTGCTVASCTCVTTSRCCWPQRSSTRPPAPSGSPPGRPDRRMHGSPRRAGGSKARELVSRGAVHDLLGDEPSHRRRQGHRRVHHGDVRPLDTRDRSDEGQPVGRHRPRPHLHADQPHLPRVVEGGGEAFQQLLPRAVEVPPADLAPVRRSDQQLAGCALPYLQVRRGDQGADQSRVGR
jgi:hypothetical protein